MQATPLTRFAILAAKTDEELYSLLASELMRLIEPCSDSTIKEFLSNLPSLPIGLRSMAAVYDLDVSLTLDDLGWHFMNRYSIDFAKETLAGLRELNTPHAEIFAEAINIACKHWDFIGSPNFINEYLDSPLDLELAPLDELMWELQGFRDNPGRSILDYWPPYARKYPEKVISTY